LFPSPQGTSNYNSRPPAPPHSLARPLAAFRRTTLREELAAPAGLAAALSLRHRIPLVDLPVRQLQEALIDDPHAPAAPVPLWDTPWHHPQWAARLRSVLDQPEQLEHPGIQKPSGLNLPDPPRERGEQLLEGQLEPDGIGGGTLHTGSTRWPVITLEPALHQRFKDLDRPRAVRLWGCLNPWGPWLRATRLAP
jgi:hypothetical protein